MEIKNTTNDTTCSILCASVLKVSDLRMNWTPDITITAVKELAPLDNSWFILMPQTWGWMTKQEGV